MVSCRLEIYGLDYPIVAPIPVPITFVQADIREPDKRKASFSKTIVLYGSNEVNKLFELIYEANTKTQRFNVNKKTPVKYFVDDLLNFKGDLQLIQITNKPDGNIEYECNILGQEGTLFVDLGNDLLSDLDFSEYDHLYSRDKIIDSWTNLCDVSGTPTTLANGEGYLYGFIQRGLNGGSESVFNVSDFLPQFYAREYLFKMLEAKGYSWNTSAILDSAEFKSIVVEPNISVVPFTQTQVEQSQFYVGLNADQTITDNATNLTAYNDETSGNGFFDVGNQQVAGVATLNYSGTYNIAATCLLDLVITHSNVTVAYAVALPTLRIELQKSGNGGAAWFTLNSGYHYFDAAGTFNMGQHYTGSNAVASGSQFFSAGDMFRVLVSFGHPLLASNWITYKTAGGATVSAGGGTGFGFDGTGVLKLLGNVANGNTFYCIPTSKQINEGAVMTVNGALPKNIKQKDFLKSVMQHFNLYINPDKQNPKLLTIESYSEYFNDGIVRWDNKIDYKKDIITNPISLVDGRKYLYQYKEDKDFYNNSYKETHNVLFGSKQIDVDNDFLTAEKKNELIFSPTPNVANYVLGIAVPKFFKEDPLISVNPITPNIRLLYFGGVKQTQTDWTFKKIGDTDLVQKDYAYVGHVDDPQTPTVDLNFSTPLSVFYNYAGSSFTTNNVYNRFHAPFINNTTNRDSKVIVAYLYLTPYDIYNFSFRKKYFIIINDSGAYYIVNKIENYNPLVSESTKVELIKVLEADVFTPSNILFTDSPDVNTGFTESIPAQNNSQRIGNSINLGTNCVAIGDNIFIPASCSNVTVIGNNVTVSEGVSNSSVINTNDYELTQSNFSITNNVVIDEYFVDGSLTTTDATPSEILFNTPSGLFDLQGVDCVVRAEIRILAVDTATGDCKEWKGAKIIKNIAGATSTNNIETVVSVYSDLSMVTCTANMYDDATPQSIEVGIVGIAATTIEWKCYVNFLRINL